MDTIAFSEGSPSNLRTMRSRQKAWTTKTLETKHPKPIRWPRSLLLAFSLSVLAQQSFLRVFCVLFCSLFVLLISFCIPFCVPLVFFWRSLFIYFFVSATKVVSSSLFLDSFQTKEPSTATNMITWDRLNAFFCSFNLPWKYILFFFFFNTRSGSETRTTISLTQFVITTAWLLQRSPLSSPRVITV